MSRISEFDEIVDRTLQDRRLSRGEKQAVQQWIEGTGVSSRRLALLRNRVFNAAKDTVRGSENAQVLAWLEGMVGAIAAAADKGRMPPALAEALFSPGDECRDRLCSLLSDCRRQAEICVFSLTDDILAQAVLPPTQRGS